MNNQLPINCNPLVIAEILTNIFGYLPTVCLVKLTYVNKMWRLEARKKLYERRSKIIYRLLKKSLITRISKFRLTFDLNMREELFLIRNQLQEQNNDANAKHAEKFKAYLEADEIIRVDESEMIRVLTGLADKRIHAHKRLVDFEYYLVTHGYIEDPDEVDEILIKCRLYGKKIDATAEPFSFTEDIEVIYAG